MSTFETELNTLLKKYLGETGIKKMNLDLNSSGENKGSFNDKINNFYKDQLQIDASSYSDRIKIDRTITFSEKKLLPENFCKFLLELGNICLSGSKLDLAIEIFKKVNQRTNLNSVKAESLIGLAEVYSKRGNWSRSLTTIANAENLFKIINDKIGLAKCENLYGYIFGKMGDIENAKHCFINSLSLIDPDTDYEMAADLEVNIGIIENIQGNFSKSLLHLENALNIYKKTNNYKSLSEVLYNIGLVYLDAEKYETAIASFDEGIEIAKTGHFLSVLCHLYLAKSRALIASNSIYYAAQFADKALEISHNIDDKLTLADIYKVKGSIERILKNFELAENNLGSSLRMNETLRTKSNKAETSLELALLYKELNNPVSKELYLKSSLNYYKEINASIKVKKIEDMFKVKVA